MLDFIRGLTDASPLAIGAAVIIFFLVQILLAHLVGSFIRGGNPLDEPRIFKGERRADLSVVLEPYGSLVESGDPSDDEGGESDQR